MKGEKEGKIAQVPDQLDRLSNELSELEKIVDMLKERLKPVLRDNTSTDITSPKDEESLVDVANSIRNHTSRTANVVAHIGSIVELLEL